MLRVAVPNKGTLAGPAAEMLLEAGYRQRGDGRELTALDRDNEVEFFFLRPKDIATYVGSGDLHLGITGRDLATDSGAGVREFLELGFGYSTFRFAGSGERAWHVEDLAGVRIATSYPKLVTDFLAARGMTAEVTRLDGAVEISIQLGLADAIADVVGSGRTLRQHGLAPFGEVICESQAVVISRDDDADLGPEARRLIERLRGVVFGQQYLMIDYNCPRALLDAASEITPGLESPTVSPLADPQWAAVRAMVLRSEANPVMDRLSAIGARAILASEIRACRM